MCRVYSGPFKAITVAYLKGTYLPAVQSLNEHLCANKNKHSLQVRAELPCCARNESNCRPRLSAYVKWEKFNGKKQPRMTVHKKAPLSVVVLMHFIIKPLERD